MNKKLKQVYLLRIVCWLSLTTEHIEILHLKTNIFMTYDQIHPCIRVLLYPSKCYTLKKYFEKKTQTLPSSKLGLSMNWLKKTYCGHAWCFYMLSWFLSSHQQHSTCNKTRGECPCNYLYSPFEVDLLPPSMHQSCSMM